MSVRRAYGSLGTTDGVAARLSSEKGQKWGKSLTTSSSPPGQQDGNGLHRYDPSRRPHRLAA